MENKKYFSVKETAEQLGVKENTIRTWCSLRKIPYMKVGRTVRFTQEQIDSIATPAETRVY